MSVLIVKDHEASYDQLKEIGTLWLETRGEKGQNKLSSSAWWQSTDSPGSPGGGDGGGAGERQGRSY